MPVKRAMSDCDNPVDRSDFKRAVVVDMRAVYAMSHSHVYSPPNYASADSARMILPHELVAELVRLTSKSTQLVATEMDKATFQGTLHKYINGHVPAPSRGTAEKMTTYFQLPVDAIYDAAVATRIAGERGITLRRKTLGVAEPAPLWPLHQPRKGLGAALETRIQQLDPAQLRGLETIVAAYLDAIVPKGNATITGT